jgi:hypothetical protein
MQSALTQCNGIAQWARSSTAEQWPFKPLVLGSNPSALTLILPLGSFLVLGPRKGMLFESQRAHSYSPFGEVFGSGSPQGDAIRIPARSLLFSLRGVFWFWFPAGGFYSDPSALTFYFPFKKTVTLFTKPIFLYQFQEFCSNDWIKKALRSFLNIIQGSLFRPRRPIRSIGHESVKHIYDCEEARR